MFEVLKKQAFALPLAAGTALVVLGQNAMAQSSGALPDATAQLSSIATNVSGYATVMFLIAITGVGIMVGVKWIKRGKSAV